MGLLQINKHFMNTFFKNERVTLVVLELSTCPHDGFATPLLEEAIAAAKQALPKTAVTARSRTANIVAVYWERGIHDETPRIAAAS